WVWALLALVSVLALVVLAWRDTWQRSDRQWRSLQTQIDGLNERLTPKLKLDGGDGHEFEKEELSPRAAERFKLLHPHEYAEENSRIKLLKVTNLSATPLSRVRVEMEPASSDWPLEPKRAPLRWEDTDGIERDLGPHMSAHVVLLR